MSETKENNEGQREKVKEMYQLIEMKMGRCNRYRKRSGDEKRIVKQTSDIKRMTEELKNNRWLQNLYWDKQKNYLKFIQEDLELSGAQVINFQRFIKPERFDLYCFVCGAKTSLLFSTYEEYKTSEEFNDNKEPICWIKGKFFDSRCPDCQKRSHKVTEEHIKKLLKLETEKQREERINWLKELGRKDYPSYLYTYHWKIIVKQAKNESVGPKQVYCDRCGRRFNPSWLEYHHTTYEYLGEEEYYLDSIKIICIDCHKTIHMNERI